MLGNNKTNCPKKAPDLRMYIYVFKSDQRSVQSSPSDLTLPLAQDRDWRVDFFFYEPVRIPVQIGVANL